MTPEEEKQTEQLQNFMKHNITPLIEEDESRRQKFKNRFWFYAGFLLFINCTNMLVVLFQYLIYHRPLSGGQLLIIAIISCLVLLGYVKCSKRIKFPDILSAFIHFYGEWNVEYSDVKTTQLSDELLPKHSKQIEKISIWGDKEYPLEIKYHIFLKRVRNDIFRKSGSGIQINIDLLQKLNGKIIFFEKGGFFKQKKYSGLELIDSNIPISNYFYSFTDSSIFKEYLVRATLFENLLNLKEIFNASKIYARLHNGKLSIFLQDGKLKYVNGSLWRSSGGEENLLLLNKQFEEIFAVIQTFETLSESVAAHV